MSEGEGRGKPLRFDQSALSRGITRAHLVRNVNSFYETPKSTKNSLENCTIYVDDMAYPLRYISEAILNIYTMTLTLLASILSDRINISGHNVTEPNMAGFSLDRQAVTRLIFNMKTNKCFNIKT